MSVNATMLNAERILVTGGCGYIGSNTVLALLEAGAVPIVVDDLSTGDKRLLPPDVSFVQADFADDTALAHIQRTFAPTSVIHFAGKIVVPESVTNPLAYYLGNTSKTRNLIEHCVRHELPIVFSSTAAVYGDPHASGPIAENAALKPINPYGRSKLVSEWMLSDAAAAHGLKFGALRYFNVAGADLKSRAGQIGPQVTHLIRVICQVALGMRTKLTVFGSDYATPDGTCVRDFIHVTDLANAHVLALSKLYEGGPNLTLNCGYGRGASVLEIIRAFERVTNRGVPYEFGARRVGDPASLVADSTEIRSRLNWSPQHDQLDTIVETALNWERALQMRMTA